MPMTTPPSTLFHVVSRLYTAPPPPFSFNAIRVFLAPISFFLVSLPAPTFCPRTYPHFRILLFLLSSVQPANSVPLPRLASPFLRRSVACPRNPLTPPRIPPHNPPLVLIC